MAKKLLQLYKSNRTIILKKFLIVFALVGLCVLLSVLSRENVISFEKSYNSGLFMGIDILEHYYVIFIQLAFILFLSVYMVKIKDERKSFSLIFLISGITASLIERIIFRNVIDYLPFIGISRINVSDILITLGIIFIIIDYITIKDDN